MTTVYRVRDWREHFENSETRKLKRLHWVPLPCKQDGDGYTELLDHEHGAAHFGAWTAMVQLAAKCDPRGSLLRLPGIPHDPRTISRITRIPREIVAEAIPRLLKIRWLEEIPISPDASGSPPEISGSRPENPPDSNSCPDLTCTDLKGPDLSRKTGQEKQQLGAAASRAPKNPIEPKREREPLPPGMLALGVDLFGSMAGAEHLIREALAGIDEERAWAWLLVMDRRSEEAKRKGEGIEVPAAYWRDLWKQGEPPDWALREAKGKIRPHKEPRPGSKCEPIGAVLE